MSLPLVVTAAGAQPQSPASILATLLANVSAEVPDYTATLPLSLIEDVSSTDVAAIALCDQAQVDTVNSLTPYVANNALLLQLGNIYGVALGIGFNTSVFVVITGSTAIGLTIPVGFTVSDGTYQYTVQDGGSIGSGGSTSPLYCLATAAGSWAVPPNSVTQIVTSVPSVYGVLTCTNPLAGTPSAGPQTFDDYRVQVIQAGLAEAQGMTTMLKTALGEVSGVQPRLISVQQQSPGWKVIVGGGDPYQVADAIFASLFDISTLVGSQILVTGITNANPGVVTTNLNHGYTTGQVINIAGVVGMSGVNNTPLTATVLTQKTFSIGINTTSSGAWTSGGVVTPNFRNVSVNLSQYPDVYTIPFVIPPQQTVGLSLTWNTIQPNFTSQVAVAQLGSAALVSYLNSIAVGAPINTFEADAVFQAAVSSVLDVTLLGRLVWAVTINGVSITPTSGTGLYYGDPESYIFATSASVSIAQG